MLRIRIDKNESHMIVDKVDKYYQLPKNIFIKQFLPSKYKYIFVENDEEADICIVGLQHTNNNNLRNDEVNILFSLENLGVGRIHYKHFNTFHEYGNKIIDLFIYNHKSNILWNEQHQEIPKMIPTVNFRIEYFKNIQEEYKHMKKIPFEEKKFCLFTSQNLLNQNKQIAYNILSGIGEVDVMKNFPHLQDKTCYHSNELLELLNQYKFVMCFENSHAEGYITEKIFNIFLAGSIPIYNGAPDIEKYIYPGSFVMFGPNMMTKISKLMNNENKYNKMVNSRKLRDNVDGSILENYLDYHLKQKGKI
jgi:hypothetical protein